MVTPPQFPPGTPDDLPRAATRLVNATPERIRTIGDALRARDEALRHEARARVAAEVSRVLGSTLECDTVLALVARAVVPTLADWCILDIVGVRDEPKRVAATAASGSEAAALVERLERLGPVAPDTAGGAFGIPVSAETTCIDDVRPEHVAAIGNPELRAVVESIGVRAQLCVSLVARGQVLGGMTLLRTGAPFAAEDRALAEDVAQRVALAVDNARLYDQAQRASLAKSAFLATVSHELRTPLQVIMGFAEMLQAGIPTEIPEPSRMQAERIARASEHLLSLVEQMLSFSRIEAGREDVRPEPVDLGLLARNALQLVESLAHRKGITLEADLPPEGAMIVPTDPGKVRQILYNLLANAVKFTDRGGVSLALAHQVGEDSARWARIEVRDTGIGMTAEECQHVFEAFWQSDQHRLTRTAPRGGTGLGLSITRELVRILGGEVAVRSEPGRGSAFVVTLPVAP